LTDSTAGGVKAALNLATVGDVDGEPVGVILKGDANAWTPYSTIRLDVIGQRIERIVDYIAGRSSC
jgi:hypothetical protein